MFSNLFKSNHWDENLETLVDFYNKTARCNERNSNITTKQQNCISKKNPVRVLY